MRIIGLFIAFAIALSGAAFAQADDFQTRLENTARLPTVGRIMFGNEGSCVGTLIDSDIVLTSAACVARTAGWQNLASMHIRFQYFPPHGAAARTADIKDAMYHPTYARNDLSWRDRTAYNISLFELDWPIPGHRATPARTALTIPVGGQAAVLTPPTDADDDLSVIRVCTLTRRPDAKISMTCPDGIPAEPLPVFRFENGALRLVTITAALLDEDGQTWIIGADLDRVGFVRSELNSWFGGVLSRR